MSALVSVIVPAYNCERYLAEAVQSALNQTYPHLEVLVIDDGSSDGTAECIRHLAEKDSRVRGIGNSENRGVAETRNRGIEMARGEYIAFLDGDDAWEPDKLERQLKFLEDSEADLCYTAYRMVDKVGIDTGRVYRVPVAVDMKRLLRENVIGCSTVLLRRDALGHIRMRGEYAHEDYVLWLEMMQSGCRMGGVDLPLMRYRVLEGSRSGNKWQAARNRWIVYRRFLQYSPARAILYFAAYTYRGRCKHR